MGPGATSGLCMNGMNKSLASVDAVRSERVNYSCVDGSIPYI